MDDRASTDPVQVPNGSNGPSLVGGREVATVGLQKVGVGADTGTVQDVPEKTGMEEAWVFLDCHRRKGEDAVSISSVLKSPSAQDR